MLRSSPVSLFTVFSRAEEEIVQGMIGRWLKSGE